MKLRLSNHARMLLHKASTVEMSDPLDLIYRAFALATVEPDDPDEIPDKKRPLVPVPRHEPQDNLTPTPPQPGTPAGDTVRAFEAWWERHNMLSTVTAKSAAYFAWVGRTWEPMPEDPRFVEALDVLYEAWSEINMESEWGRQASALAKAFLKKHNYRRMDAGEPSAPEPKPQPSPLEDDDAFEEWFTNTTSTTYRETWMSALAWERTRKGGQ